MRARAAAWTSRRQPVRKSTLGLSYASSWWTGSSRRLPSNTARGGVLYPLVVGLAEAGGATPANASRGAGRLPDVLGMVSLSLSSALWFTAMAANPLGAEMAAASRDDELRLVADAASVPTLPNGAAAWILQKIMSPEVTSTPDARRGEARAGGARTPVSRRTNRAATFIAWWRSGLGRLPRLDSTAIALLGLGSCWPQAC